MKRNAPVLTWWRRLLHPSIPAERLAEMTALRERQAEVANRLKALSLELDVMAGERLPMNEILEHHDLLSILTLCAALVGVGLSVWGLHDAWHDYVLLAPSNGARRLLASGHLRNDAFRLVAQLLLATIATVTLALPPMPATMPADVVLLLVLRKVLRLGLSLLIMLGVALDRKDRISLWARLA